MHKNSTPEELLEHDGLWFYVRNGYSDKKTFDEVIVGKAYQKKDFKIEAGERWLDLGANVGAFTCFAEKQGAVVTSVEPDIRNVRQLRKNIKENSFKADVLLAACVHDSRKSIELNLWPGGQSWRNSVVRTRRGAIKETVPCVNFFDIIGAFDCLKMDIEGAEIPILEAWSDSVHLKKMVFEYSFDVDPDCERLRKIIERLKKSFKTVQYSSQIDTLKAWTFFPPCTNIFCCN